jgi:hypothetical protein
MKLKTPVERYNNDPHFRNLVKYMEALIHQAQFTPSELREAVMLAAINYEMSRLSTVFVENDDVNNALNTLSRCLEEVINRPARV